MKRLIPSFAYFSVAVIFIVFRNGIPGIILKALIMPLLALVLVTGKVGGWKKSDILILLALFFSWAGDVLLEVPASVADLFIPGLVSFLLAHVMYLIVFFSTPVENIVLKKKTWLLIPVVLYGWILLILMFESLGQMKIPVTVYTVVILTMVTGALCRLGRVSRRSWITVLSGAVLFLLSDTGIAINKFLHPIPASSVLIMSTYVLGQYLIITGYLNGQVNND